VFVIIVILELYQVLQFLKYEPLFYRGAKNKRGTKMKKLTILSATIVLSSLLVACGGGSGSDDSSGSGSGAGAATGGTGGSAPAQNSDSLIIDNGRGTTNNQDTEKPKS